MNRVHKMSRDLNVNCHVRAALTFAESSVNVHITNSAVYTCIWNRCSLCIYSHFEIAFQALSYYICLLFYQMTILKFERFLCSIFLNQYNINDYKILRPSLLQSKAESLTNWAESESTSLSPFCSQKQTSNYILLFGIISQLQ